MTTNPTPTYSAVSTGGDRQEAQPPVYNSVGASPAYNPAVGPSAPNPSAPVIQYVDQHGNPVRMPPGQAPTIQYVRVDQYGNPVAAPQSNIQLLQYGQAPPQQVVLQSVQPAYPASGPSTAAATPDSGPSIEEQRQALSYLGILVAISIGIGLILNDLSFSESNSGVIHCGWSEIRLDEHYTGEDSSVDSSGLCLDYECLCEQETLASEKGGYTWCDTQSAGRISLICCITSASAALLGAIMYWPRQNVCANSTGKGWYMVCIISVVVGFVVWSMDEKCNGDGDVGTGTYMEMGGSKICLIIGFVFAMVAVLSKFVGFS
eukprot:168279_1